MSKQCLDVQQMQHLQELGLDTSNASALYCIDNESGEKQLMWNEQVEETDKDDEYFRIVTAYTLQDVLDALPEEINSGTRRFWLRIDFSDECLYYYYDDYKFVEHRKKVIGYDGMDGLIDAAYELLCWCIEQGYVETNKKRIRYEKV